MKKHYLIFLTIIAGILLIVSMFFPVPNYSKVTENVSGEINLNVGDNYEFYLDTTDQNINALEFVPNSYSLNTLLEVTIYENENIIYKNAFDALNHAYSYKLAPIKEIKNTDKIKLRFELLNSDAPISLKANENGNPAINKYVKTSNSYYYTLICFIIFLALLAFLVLKSKFSNSKNNKTIIKIITGSLFVIFSILGSIFVLKSTYYLVYENKYLYTILSLISYSFVVFYICSHIKEYKNNYARLFLLLAIPIGCLYCSLSMPSDAIDDYSHFAKSYSTSKGVLSTIDVSQVYIPDTYKYNKTNGFGNSNELHKYIKLETDYSRETKWINNTAASYSFIYYIFSGIGLFIARVFHLNMYVGWYLAKYFNLFVYILIGFITIKKMPKFKLLTLLYLLMPHALYQGSNLSVDCIINASTLLFIAWILDITSNFKKIHIVDFIVIILTSLLMIQAKPVYLPLIFIFLIYLVLKSNIKKKALYFFSIFTLLIVSYLLLQGTMFSQISYGSNNYVYGTTIKYVITNPLLLIKTYFHYCFSNINEFTFNLIGDRMGWTGNAIPVFYTFIYLIIMLLSCIFRNKEDDYNLLEKIMFIFIYIACSFLIFFALYTQDIKANVYAGYVFLLNARYYIPFSILLFLCLNNIPLVKKENIDNSKINNIIILFAIIIHVIYIINFIEFVVF